MGQTVILYVHVHKQELHADTFGSTAGKGEQTGILP